MNNQLLKSNCILIMTSCAVDHAHLWYHMHMELVKQSL